MLGIVIHSEKVKEADVKIKVLSPEGLGNFTLRGAQKAVAKLKAAGGLFCLADFNVIEHKAGLPYKIIGANVIDTHHGITKDINRYYLACAICEVIARCEGTGFELTAAALEKLATAPLSNNSGDFLREVYTWYFTELLKELGYDVEDGQDINTAYLRHLDIRIPKWTM